MPIIGSKGAESSGGFGQFAQSGAVNYIEDVFSTYLYTANNTTQTITNGIDLAGKGGLMWFKTRNTGGAGATHTLVDSARGNNGIFSSLTSAQSALSGGSGTITLNANGFTINGGVYSAQGNINNGTTDTLVSWTFRKQPKFFDIVTYTGTGSNTTIPHNLGSVPGCIIIKKISAGSNQHWIVYHQSLPISDSLFLDLTNAAGTYNIWNGTAPTSSVFSIGTDASVNGSGDTYVAYLFASNAGGFGAAGTDNVITCGSFTDSTSGVVSLGYEPQFLLLKDATAGGQWLMVDNMRGFSQTSASRLFANLAQAENTITSNNPIPTATGFTTNDILFSAGSTVIYIAIRRGPMKTPTTGTSVFNIINSGNATGTVKTTGIVPDLAISKVQSPSAINSVFEDRLREFPNTDTAASGRTLIPSAISAEQTTSPFYYNWNSTTATIGSNSATGWTSVSYFFQRAPGFFDEVCYTGNSTSGRTIAHNLGVAPEIIILKRRNQNNNFWWVYQNSLTAGDVLSLSETNATTSNTSIFTTTAPTSSVFSVGGDSGVNSSSGTYVAYLFATCAGVSKVGSYTGTGTLTTINCGFTGGARFVMIKKTSGISDWFVWDTARGMVSGTDPSLSLNTTSAESNANSVYTITTGFQLLASPSADVNTNAATYIYLAIA